MSAKTTEKERRPAKLGWEVAKGVRDASGSEDKAEIKVRNENEEEDIGERRDEASNGRDREMAGASLPGILPRVN